MSSEIDLSDVYHVPPMMTPPQQSCDPPMLRRVLLLPAPCFQFLTAVKNTWLTHATRCFYLKLGHGVDFLALQGSKVSVEITHLQLTIVCLQGVLQTFKLIIEIIHFLSTNLTVIDP